MRQQSLTERFPPANYSMFQTLHFQSLEKLIDLNANLL